MQKLSHWNSGVKFLLVLVEVLSNFMWVRALKSKKTRDILAAFEYLLSGDQLPEEMGEPPISRLQTDEGSEFMSKEFRQLMRQHGVYHFWSDSRDVKAAVAEVHIRELKRKLYKYMTEYKTKRYVDQLQDIVVGINGRLRNRIRMAPKDVNFVNAGLVLKRRYPNIFQEQRRFPLKFTFHLGDTVKISLQYEKLRHGYLQNYSDEIYQITALVTSDPPRYRLSTLTGEKIEGKFYAEELIRAKPAELVE